MGPFVCFDNTGCPRDFGADRIKLDYLGLNR